VIGQTKPKKAKRRKMGLLLCIAACCQSSFVGCGTLSVAEFILAMGNYDKKNTQDEASPFFLYRCRLLGRPLYQIVGGIFLLILLGLCLPLLSRWERGGVMNYWTLGLWTGYLLGFTTIWLIRILMSYCASYVWSQQRWLRQQQRLKKQTGLPGDMTATTTAAPQQHPPLQHHELSPALNSDEECGRC
jgi:hypothetical protein